MVVETYFKYIEARVPTELGLIRLNEVDEVLHLFSQGVKVYRHHSDEKDLQYIQRWYYDREVKAVIFVLGDGTAPVPAESATVDFVNPEDLLTPEERRAGFKVMQGGRLVIPEEHRVS